MKVIILAAGMGKRLGMSMPKALVPLENNKVILDYQIEKLQKYFSIEDIILVVGFKKDLVTSRHPNITYITNERYADTNTSKSLLLAINEINDTDALWLNGDVYFDDQVIKKFVNAKNNCLLIDDKKCGDEEVKYTTDNQGHINQISKEIKNPKGEALGINLIKSDDLESFRKHLELVSDDDYFEKAIENMVLQDNKIFVPKKINNLFCQEIDFPEDLENVKSYINDNK